MRFQKRLQKLLPRGFLIEMHSKFTKESIQKMMDERDLGVPKNFLTGAQPDGGILCIRTPSDRLIPFYFSEAKHQKGKGNASERMFKNVDLLTKISPHITGLVVASGAVASDPDSEFRRTISQVLVVVGSREQREWDIPYVGGFSAYANPNKKQIKQAMESVLESALLEVLNKDPAIISILNCRKAEEEIRLANGDETQLIQPLMLQPNKAIEKFLKHTHFHRQLYFSIYGGIHSP